MPTIFTRIIDGEIPGTFVWRDEVCVGFLSINPMAAGHVLVVPRAEEAHWIDLPVETNEHLMRVAHAIGRAQVEAFRCARVGLIVAGYEVPHVHIHVIPTNHMGELSFANAAASVLPAELAEHADRIRDALRKQGATGVV